jgi:hypothetical protein
MEMLQTHCYATGTVTLLWKRYKLTVMQQALSFNAAEVPLHNDVTSGHGRDYNNTLWTTAVRAVNLSCACHLLSVMLLMTSGKIQ